MGALPDHWFWVPTVAPGARCPAAEMQVSRAKGVTVGWFILGKASFTQCAFYIFFFSYQQASKQHIICLKSHPGPSFLFMCV